MYVIKQLYVCRYEDITLLNTKRVFFIVDKIIEKRVSITNVSVKVVSKTIVKITIKWKV